MGGGAVGGPAAGLPLSCLPESIASQRAYCAVFREQEDGCHLQGTAGEA